MWQVLMHLWEPPPADLTLVCPAPAAGQPVDPQGFYDATQIIAAFDWAAVASAIVVVVTVIVCYQLARGSLGGRFVRRWWISLVASGALCLGVVWGILATWPTVALANSCATNPDAFPVSLPGDVIWSRAFVGLVWGALAFIVASLIATFFLGRFAHAKNGFFHHRGCPWPRFQP
jgi:hypothetical protein